MTFNFWTRLYFLAYWILWIEVAWHFGPCQPLYVTDFTPQIQLTCTTSSLDSKSDMMMSLPSSNRVMATARRPLARWCALEGRCLRKTISSQWRTLIEGLNGPSVKAFNCLAKLIISSRMETATQNTQLERRCGFGGKEQCYSPRLTSHTTAAATRDPADAPRTRGAKRIFQGA